MIFQCDCLVVVFSLTEQASLATAKTILHNLSQVRDMASNKAVILVGNKTDLVRARVVPSQGNK